VFALSLPIVIVVEPVVETWVTREASGSTPEAS
jgi:hypothetical protein